MLWAINLLVLQEAAVTLASAHEVVVTGARGEAAADGRSCLLALLTALRIEGGRQLDSVRQTPSRGGEK